MKTAGKLICLLLAAALCPTLASCASSGAEEKKQEDAGFEYVSEFRELFRDSREFISVRGFEDGALYYSKEECVGDNTPEGVTADFEGQYGVYETFLYYIDADGNKSSVKQYKTMDAPTNEEHKRNFASGSALEGICFTQDGFVTVESTYAYWTEGSGQEQDDESEAEESFMQQYFIRSFDRTGQELSCAPMEVSENDWLQFENMQLDSEGNVIVSAGNSLRAIGLDGKDAYTIETSADTERLLRLRDGRLAAVTNKNGKRISILDTGSRRLEEGTPIDFEIGIPVVGYGEYDICYVNGDYFYAYRLGDKEPVKLFSLTAVNVSSADFSPLGVSPDGTVTGIILTYSGTGDTLDADLVTIRRVSGNASSQKQIIRLAVLSADYNMQNLVIDFNRHSDQYRIEIADYSANGDSQNSSSGETLLKTEILSGNVPDILCLSGLNYRQLAGMGVLEDLYPYIDADPELDRADFFPNVLASMEVNGKLCSTVSGFYLQSVIGASSVVGEEPGWNYDEFNAALASMPEGCTAFDESTTRDDILSACLALDMANYVDWDSGKVSFDRPEFIRLLKFANSFPTEEDWENYDFSQEDDIGGRLSQGRQMLVQTGSCGLEEVLFNNYSQYLGGRITYIGYPTTNGTGSMFSFDEEPAYAMSSSSAHKDAVWQFLRMFLSKSFQSKEIASLPSRIDVFEAKAAEAATVQYQKNDDGKFILNAKGEKIPIARFIVWDSETNSTMEIYAVTEEQIEKVRQLIQTTDKVADYNQGILDIVEEQAAPFFAGQKSAEEVTKLIQSKASIFVSEQS